MTRTVPSGIDALLAPKSIAVLGASQTMDSINGKPVRYLLKHGYRGDIFPVNPRYEEVGGLRCYPDLESVGQPVDLAIVALRAGSVLASLEACARSGTGAVIVMSAGFAEGGSGGRELQDRAAALCRTAGMRLLGPNCQGFVNIADGVCASFSEVLESDELIGGSLAFISQSGAFGYSTFALGQADGVGFSHVVSTGNEADVSWIELVDHMVDQPDVRAIACYIEGVQDGRAYARVARRAMVHGKPLMVLSAGRGQAGQRAARSHTAAVAGDASLFDAISDQHGVIRLTDVDDLLDMARIFDRPTPSPAGARVAVVSTSGGAGVLIADQLEDLGAALPAFSPETQARVDAVVPPLGSPLNPVDTSAQVVQDLRSFDEILAAVADSADTDAVCVAVTMVTGWKGERLMGALSERLAPCHKPVAVAYSTPAKLAPRAHEILAASGLPVYPTPVRAARALGRYLRHCAQRTVSAASASTPVADGVLRRVRSLIAEGQPSTEAVALDVLAAAGLPVVRRVMVSSALEAERVFETFSPPVVIKAVSPDLAHKSEVGGVTTGVRRATDAGDAVAAMAQAVAEHAPDAALTGYLVQEQAAPGLEVFLGSVVHAVYGTVVVTGVGGLYAEQLGKLASATAPLSAPAVTALFQASGLARLFNARGARHDVAGMVELVVGFSALADALSDDVSEFDVNPVILPHDGRPPVIVDALFTPADGTRAT